MNDFTWKEPLKGVSARERRVERSGTRGGQAKRVGTLEEGDGTRTRVRRPAAGAHRGTPQFFPGFRYAPPGATFRRPFRTQTITSSRTFSLLKQVEKYVSAFMNSSTQRVT